MDTSGPSLAVQRHAWMQISLLTVPCLIVCFYTDQVYIVFGQIVDSSAHLHYMIWADNWLEIPYLLLFYCRAIIRHALRGPGLTFY